MKLKRGITTLVMVLCFFVLAMVSMVSTAPVAGACVNCFARPTVGNGGLPYGKYVRQRGSTVYLCYQYVGRADECWPLYSTNFGITGTLFMS